MPRASVVVATYNRPDSVERLVRQLASQTVRDIEVIVVDDGSRDDPTSRLRSLPVPFDLVVERQTNAGAAAARNRGAALARAPIILFLDDDMQVDDSIVAAHLALHDGDSSAVVLGHIKPDDGMQLELFERFHADVLERFATDVMDGRRTVHGTNVYTGNLSLRRDAFLRVGGFDPAFRHAEDAELGVRLEKDGAHFYLSDQARSIHSSDRSSLQGWRARARTYGASDSRIARKHPEVLHANPWRYFHDLSPIARPWLAVGVGSPLVGARIATAVLRAAALLDRARAEQPALRAVTLAFGLEYAGDLREELGSLPDTITEWLAYVQRSQRGGASGRLALAGLKLRRAVLADHATLERYSAKYGGETSSIQSDAVVRIGFQLMCAVRLMHFFRDAGVTRAAMVTSRLIRHLYGSDIHWEADIAPGVQVVHGMGLAISAKAHVSEDVILFQNVTLGESSNGAPSVGRGVHVGPGATLLGNIHVGEGTKIMAGCVVRDDVPARSIVSAAHVSTSARLAS